MRTIVGLSCKIFHFTDFQECSDITAVILMEFGTGCPRQIITHILICYLRM